VGLAHRQHIKQARLLVRAHHTATPTPATVGTERVEAVELYPIAVVFPAAVLSSAVHMAGEALVERVLIGCPIQVEAIRTRLIAVAATGRASDRSNECG
jgi:hypothetical protein